MKITQAEQILDYMKRGNSVTPLSALEMFGCFRLAARCHELKAAGHPIKAELVKVGKEKAVARYFLERAL